MMTLKSAAEFVAIIGDVRATKLLRLYMGNGDDLSFSRNYNVAHRANHRARSPALGAQWTVKATALYME